MLTMWLRAEGGGIMSDGARGASSPDKESGGLKAEVYDWTEAVVFSVGAVVLLFTFVFRIVGVDGWSMLDTLGNGDRVMISVVGAAPKRGDIVVLTTKAVDKPIIKRVIAVGGQTVDIDYDRHTVEVDGKILSEPYIREPTAFRGQDPVAMPVRVPKGFVFVMGDNRNESLDSRSAAIGLVDERQILGKAVFRIFPLKGFGIL